MLNDQVIFTREFQNDTLLCSLAWNWDSTEYLKWIFILASELINWLPFEGFMLSDE